MPDVIADRYEVLAPIGQGGMAAVYRALDTRLGRVVAVKLLRETCASDPAFARRFENEARAAARLSHPSVVDVYDYDSSDGRYFITMEYVPGPNLKEYVREHAPLPEEEVRRLAGQLLEGLGAAHAVGLIHRDMKPQNVLVAADGRLKIADFGIAKAVGDAGVTEAGVTVGTAHYMAPEQVCGYEVSPRADLYAVGVMLYEMLTGVLPFDGDAPIGVAYAHVFEQLRPLRELAPGVSPGMAAVVERAMAKDPEERYADAGEMLAALAGVATGGEPVPARPGRRSSRGSTSAPTAVNLPKPGSIAPAGAAIRSNRRESRPYRAVPLLLLLALAGLAGYTVSRDPSPPISARQVRTVGSPTAGLLPAADSVSPVAAAATDEIVAAPTGKVATPVASTPVPAQAAAPTTAPTAGPGGAPPPTNAPPTPTTARPAAGAPQGGAPRKRLVTAELDATEFEGGYWLPDGYKGRTAEWVYGQRTDYSEMTAEFRIEGKPKGDRDGRAGMGVAGMDSPGPRKTRIRIEVNGKVVHEGDNPLGDDTRDESTANWTKWSKLFPASYLREGNNRVTITNLEEAEGTSGSFFILDSTVIVYYD